MKKSSNRKLSDKFWDFCTPSEFNNHKEFLTSQYKKGISTNELSRIMGISVTPIKKKLKELGIKLRSRGCCILSQEVRDKISKTLKLGYNLGLYSRSKRRKINGNDSM